MGLLMVFLDARAALVRVLNILVLLALLASLSSSQSPPGQLAPGQDSERKNAPGQNPAPPANQVATPAGSQEPNQSAGPQAPIAFESRGMEYEALTRNGITVMFAALPPHIKDYNIVQVTVTNG